MSISHRSFKRTVLRELKNKNLSIFAGAGLSRGSGFVDWKGLLKDIARDLQLDINKEHDLVSVAQYHYNENGRDFINQEIVQEFQRKASKNENMNILSRLPITNFWTTNYDSIIEDTLRDVGKVVDIKIEQGHMKYNKPNRDVVVYKMHGDKEDPHRAVITRDDYERYEENRGIFTTYLKGELVSKTFIFIGFSFDDPNLEQILSKVRIELVKNGEEPKTHFCFFREINQDDDKYKSDDGNINYSEYQYEKTKQNLKIKDLKKYGIRSVLVKDYAEITEILKDIEEKFMINNVFISGSAYEYGKYSKEKAENLLYTLSNSLASEGYHIFSGFGLGVGSFIINGALDFVFQENGKIEEYLTIRPFPQVPPKGYSLQALWDKYRRQIIRDCGIAIFVFGNKLDGGSVINADGVLKEFRIAKEKNKYIIPIGSTGYATKDIFDEIKKDRHDYWYLEDSIPILESSTKQDEIINEIFKIINRIKEDV